MLFDKEPRILELNFPLQSLNFRPLKPGLEKASQQQRPLISIDWYDTEFLVKRPEDSLRASVRKFNGLWVKSLPFQSKLSNGYNVALDSGSKQGL